MDHKKIQDISYEYIRGLAESGASFTFSTDNIAKRKIPAFSINMSIDNKDLLELIKNRLGLKNKIYEYVYPEKNGLKRASTAILIVRGLGNIKNVIIPLFYGKLIGAKARSFDIWIDTIGNDSLVPESYKFVYKLYKSGYYDGNHAFD